MKATKILGHVLTVAGLLMCILLIALWTGLVKLTNPEEYCSIEITEKFPTLKSIAQEIEAHEKRANKINAQGYTNSISYVLEKEGHRINIERLQDEYKSIEAKCISTEYMIGEQNYGDNQ